MQQVANVELSNVLCAAYSQVLNAPKRRVDNEISRLSDAVQLLQRHCKVVHELTSRYRALKLRMWTALAGTVTIFSCVTAAEIFLLNFPMTAVLSTGGIGALSTMGMYWWMVSARKDFALHSIKESFLVEVFRKLYAPALVENDEYTASLWQRVLVHLNVEFAVQDVRKLPRVSASEFKKLADILETKIPELRRVVAPEMQRKDMTFPSQRRDHL